MMSKEENQLRTRIQNELYSINSVTEKILNEINKIKEITKLNGKLHDATVQASRSTNEVVSKVYPGELPAGVDTDSVIECPRVVPRLSSLGTSVSSKTRSQAPSGPSKQPT